MTPAPLRRIVLASGNPGKLREFRALLASQPVELVSLAAGPPVAFPAEGADYAVNARAKAAAVAEQLGEVAIADDSGLEVNALGGAPGPLSARFGGPGLDDAERADRLLSSLEESGSENRRARFVCVVALVAPDGTAVTTRGVCEGRLRRAASGRAGFGYDPIFEPLAEAGRGRTMAELDAEVKNGLSHRGRAVALLLQTQSWARLVSM